MNQDAPANTDQRKFTRVPFDAKVQLTFGTTEDQIQLHGELNDISFKGLMVSLAKKPYPEKSHPLTVGHKGKATVQLLSLQGSAEQISFPLDVIIRHIGSQSLGLHVEQMPIEAAEHLRTLIQHNLGDEELLKRELDALMSSEPV